ncbi:hypothetical protein Bca4012_101817 [Brassica carinata]|uniref:Uncharacterized protein n=1 Tax=Brassica carinata TaxID=52824 RepID=A0A8X7PKG7_BRACI|nr:hypothetical protein Bca52824_084240 [Brassica carinata]
MRLITSSSSYFPFASLLRVLLLCGAIFISCALSAHSPNHLLLLLLSLRISSTRPDVESSCLH